VTRHFCVLFIPWLFGLGCAVGPDFHRPAVPDDAVGFVRDPAKETVVADGKAQRVVEGPLATADWWQMLHCPALDSIVRHAIAANPGLESARATLRRSQDNLRAGAGIFFPQIDAKAGLSRQRYNPVPGTLPGSVFNLFTLSGTVSYSLDLWGGARREFEALEAGVEAQRFALAGAYVMLAGNVVNAVIAQASYRAEIEATEAAVSLLREQVRIGHAQVTAGTIPYVNVLSLESQLASTEATVPPLEQKIDQSADLLAALTGTTPATFRRTLVLLSDLDLPRELPVSLPSEMVRQRPDILIAEAQLHAANAGIGVATAAMLPNLTLSADYGANSTTPSSLFSAGSVFWGLGAGLTQPLFHGGTLYYQRKAAIDARDVAAADYRQTVLAAFEQVADVLQGLRHDADALVAQTAAVGSAERAMRLVEANYDAGVATYLQVLVANGQYLQSKVGYVQAVAQRLQDTAALCVALGGGWWNTPAATHG
jgi:NodT family efflux transporter outer membrane factor (OMF) lipoprotein